MKNVRCAGVYMIMSICGIYNKGLNMFLIPQVSVNFRISPSSKLYTNLVLHLSKCVNLVLLTKFC